MKKIMVSLLSLVFILLFCGTAGAQAHANRYGGGTPTTAGIPPRAPMLTAVAQRTPLDREPLPPTHMVALRIMRKDLEKQLRPTHMAVARHTPPDREPPPPTHMVALRIMRKGLERRLRPTHMVVARHITREVAPSLQIPMAKQPMVTPTTIHPLPIMDTIHLLPRRTTEQHATTARLARLRVPQPPAS